MLRIFVVLTFYLLLCNFVDGVDTETKGEHYFKKNSSTAALKDGPDLNKKMVPITEGVSTKQQESKINEEKLKTDKGDKIKARKGAFLTDDKNDQTEHISEKPATIKPDIPSSTHEVQKQNKSMTSTTTTTTTTTNTTTQRTSTFRSIPVTEEQEKPINITSSTTVKISSLPKPKPQLTVGEGPGDEPIKPASPTNQTRINLPRPIDYIVPVAITVTVLPLLGVAFYVLYKRGRDYWDKRHYRRMDFLIDGMYNE